MRARYRALSRYGPSCPVLDMIPTCCETWATALDSQKNRWIVTKVEYAPNR